MAAIVTLVYCNKAPRLPSELEGLLSINQNPNQIIDSGDLAGADYWDGRITPSAAPTGQGIKDRLRRFNTRGMDRMLQTLFAEIPTGERVIELGCAPGWMLCRLHRLRPDLCFSGIDYAAQGVRDTREILQRAQIDAEIFESDITAFDPKDLFDAVISCGLVEHFDCPENIVAHHVRMARPGGLVIITVPNFRTAILGQVFKWLSPTEYATHNIDVMSPPALLDLANKAGLINIQAGGGAGPNLYTSPRVRPGILGRLYLLSARVWNLCTASLPDRFSPWHGHFWVVGRVPQDQQHQDMSIHHGQTLMI